LELWNRDSQGIPYAPETSLTRTRRRAGDLLNEISAKRVIRSADRSLGFADELRNNV
jgi:hypothetical protein